MSGQCRHDPIADDGQVATAYYPLSGGGHVCALNWVRRRALASYPVTTPWVGLAQSADSVMSGRRAENDLATPTCDQVRKVGVGTDPAGPGIAADQRVELTAQVHGDLDGRLVEGELTGSGVLAHSDQPNASPDPARGPGQHADLVQ